MSRNPNFPPGRPGAPAPRILFLDDDPRRAEVFLAERPHAVWVQTVAECLARLEESWDEVHLDHDLGGEQYVGPEREDCGMEVVRWLCLSPRPHLLRTRFLVHSHNPNGANLMGMQMMVNGYAVEVRPFGSSSSSSSSSGYQEGPAEAYREPHPFWKALRNLLLAVAYPGRTRQSAEVLEHLRAHRARLGTPPARPRDDPSPTHPPAR